MSEVLSLTQDEIRALLDLIEFHEDWDEVSEIVGVNVAQLYDKVAALVTYWCNSKSPTLSLILMIMMMKH